LVVSIGIELIDRPGIDKGTLARNPDRGYKQVTRLPDRRKACG